MQSRWKLKLRKAAEKRRKQGILKQQKKNKRKQIVGLSGAEQVFPNKVFYFLKKREFGKRSQIPKFSSKVVNLFVPNDFSISDNPEATIDFLKELYYYGTRHDIEEIHIDHGDCYNLEIAASTIMDVIVLAIKEFRRRNKTSIGFSGTIPAEGRVKDVFMASGLAAHLDLSIENGVSINWEKIKRFKLISGYHHSEMSGVTATKLTDYIITCMETQGYTLKQRGKNLLGNLFGEVLNNCEIHGGEDTTWFALGHYQQYKNSEKYGEIQLVIFNFGNTIYEQLKADSISGETKENLNYLTDRHVKFFNKNWTKEMLYTLFALQEGVSRLKNNSVEGNRRRGLGTVYLIQNFQQIGKTHDNKNPLMTITSGNTHIKFDGSYKLRQKEFDKSEIGGGKRRIIAFNEDNDIFQPPDSKFVRRLNTFFPGTIISMKFFFDGEYLTQIMQGVH